MSGAEDLGDPRGGVILLSAQKHARKVPRKAERILLHRSTGPGVDGTRTCGSTTIRVDGTLPKKQEIRFGSACACTVARRPLLNKLDLLKYVF